MRPCSQMRRASGHAVFVKYVLSVYSNSIVIHS